MPVPMITSFKGPHAFLSNFYAVSILYYEKQYPTAEHLFQAMKCANPADVERIRNAETPGKAKRLGRTVQLRSDWNEVRIAQMRTVLYLKFRNARLAQQLLATGGAMLIEGNTWNDTFWGATWNGTQWVGQNHLGLELMKLRTELRSQR